jgi:hypothetical protein
MVLLFLPHILHPGTFGFNAFLGRVATKEGAERMKWMAMTNIVG